MEGGTLVAKNPVMPSMHQTAATQRLPPKMFKETAVPDMRMGNLRDRGAANVLPAGIANAAQFDGKRMRKAIHRKTIDYNPTIIRYLEDRVFQRDHRDRPAIQPDSLHACQLLPPSALLDKPMNCVTTKFVRTSTNKFRCPIFCLTWTPEGRRLVTGASSGEFTLWNGLTFNFETILQAHDSSVRAMRWSHNDLWMVTADHAGYIKYWQSNMNNVKMYQGHKEAIRGIRCAVMLLLHSLHHSHIAQAKCFDVFLNYFILGSQCSLNLANADSGDIKLLLLQSNLTKVRSKLFLDHIDPMPYKTTLITRFKDWLLSFYIYILSLEYSNGECHLPCFTFQLFKSTLHDIVELVNKFVVFMFCLASVYTLSLLQAVCTYFSKFLVGSAKIVLTLFAKECLMILANLSQIQICSLKETDIARIVSVNTLNKV